MGEVSPVRRSTRLHTADVTTRTKDRPSTHTLKHGRTDDDERNGKGGKKARMVNLSSLFMHPEMKSHLYQARAVSPIDAASSGSDLEENTSDKAIFQPKPRQKVIHLLVVNIG